MTSNLFTIAPDVAVRFPDLKIGVAIVRGVSVQPSPPSLVAETTLIIEDVRRRFTTQDLATHPYLQRLREIYRGFDVDPKSKRPSAEALLRRVLTPGKDLYRINSVVDAYNLASIEHRVPMAAYDLAAVHPPIELRFARPGDMHRPIGGAVDDVVPSGELVYADAKRVLCRAFNYRDADATRVTETTRDVVLFVDGCGTCTTDDVILARDAATIRLRRYCGGTVEQAFVVVASPEAVAGRELT